MIEDDCVGPDGFQQFVFPQQMTVVFDQYQEQIEEPFVSQFVVPPLGGIFRSRPNGLPLTTAA
ncbi:MAG TPA: hypothetical protein VE715_04565 [Blastocatellia bacterium]|nr:hypothetical protein [Blastocatellia bacterium]